MESTVDNPHFICERLRRLYLHLDGDGKSGSDDWKLACVLYGRIGSRSQIETDIADAEALLSQFGL
jgi:hypothetical protein